MKIKLGKRDIPRYTDEKADPIDLGNGLSLRLIMEYDDSSSPGDYLPDLVDDKPVEELYDKMVDQLEEGIRDVFDSAEEYGDDVEFAAGDFSWADGPPGMWVDDGGRDSYYSHKHRYMPENITEKDCADPVARRKDNYRDAMLWAGWLSDRWSYVVVGAVIEFNGAEVGSNYCGGVEWGLSGDDEHHLEMYAECAAEAWAEVKANMEQMAGQLDAIGQTAVMSERLEVERAEN